ncbi:MBL fold metallo-hydrolase [Desulfatiferula olefinivorans]
MTSASVTLTLLVDNHSENGCRAEHGFSMWIEADGRNILFDTGQTHAFYANAKRLGIDADRADLVVLSHGHYDHTGGLPHAVHQDHPVHLYGHPGIVRPRYSIREGVAAPIHMPRPSMVTIDRLPREYLHWVHRPMTLTDRIGLTGPIPRLTGFEDTGGPFFLDPAGHRPDPIDDDLALWINTDLGLVVCCGCCHSGLINTLNRVRALTDEPRIRAVIGGFHLVNADEGRLEQTAAALNDPAVAAVIPCHCTGDAATAYLERALGPKVLTGGAGKVFTF